jgi:hypothetical protein
LKIINNHLIFRGGEGLALRLIVIVG